MGSYEMVLLICGVVFLLSTQVISQQFDFPDVVLQAYTPKGFRVYIEDRPGFQLFSFQGKVNDKIEGRTIGDISIDVTSPTEGKWTYFDPELELTIGDKIFFWAYVQSERVGHSKFDLDWTVTTLIDDVNNCGSTRTTASGIDKQLCQGNLFFEDDFRNGVINTTFWTIEQYIPLYSEENYEFVSYEDINKCRFIRDSKLYLKPVIVGDNEIIGTLDLTKGCTRSSKVACFHQRIGSNIIPPVKSAKIVSKMSFKYGKVEIRAKLPIGDWIYPQIELIPKNPSKQYPKFLIAYSRGNERLTLNNGDDLGSKLLFGGYASSSREPQRSELLRSTTVSSPVGSDMNVYTLIWTPSKIEVLLNNNVYGTILRSFSSDEYRISLGVGVGGNVDFPDGVMSGSFVKPWENDMSKQAKKFFDEKSTWASTWRGDDVALQVDYIRVYAV